MDSTSATVLQVLPPSENEVAKLNTFAFLGIPTDNISTLSHIRIHTVHTMPVELTSHYKI